MTPVMKRYRVKVTECVEVEAESADDAKGMVREELGDHVKIEVEEVEERKDKS